MAEYIDREKLLSKVKNNYIEDAKNGYDYYDYLLKDDLMSEPTADVTEREKVDSAIAEIKELYKEWENSTDDARLESNPFGAVLNIIQRNIGE